MSDTEDVPEKESDDVNPGADEGLLDNPPGRKPWWLNLGASHKSLDASLPFHAHQRKPLINFPEPNFASPGRSPFESSGRSPLIGSTVLKFPPADVPATSQQLKRRILSSDGSAGSK